MLGSGGDGMDAGFAEPGLHVEWTGCVYIPYGVPIWDLGFDANLLATEGRPTCKVMS